MWTNRLHAIAALALMALAIGCAMPAAADDTSYSRIARGRYLARAGDCAACHTADAGKPYAGGRAVPTPFGTIYSTNITPDKDSGIGTWTDAEFYNAVHSGIAPGGRHLYPAFPYPWYTRLTQDDVLALRAFLKTFEPVNQHNKPTELPWPLSWRGGVAVWNALFFEEGAYAPDASKNAEWNRGAYLAEGLGHCTACHSPKNILGGTKKGESFTGGFGEHWFSPSLRNDRPDGLGTWSVADIVDYLKTGATARAMVPAGPMGEVVTHSTQHLTQSDLAAMAAYLKDLAPTHADRSAKTVERPVVARGEALYVDQCAGCHMSRGEGVPHVFPALAGNSALQANEPANLLRVVLEGGKKVGTLRKPVEFGMPAFDGKLNDAQVADVLTYVRNAWGNHAPTISADAVRDARDQLRAQRHASAR